MVNFMMIAGEYVPVIFLGSTVAKETLRIKSKDYDQGISFVGLGCTFFMRAEGV